MKKSTKGALAFGAATVLLMGGAGTLAFWSASETLDGGSVNTGTLGLSAVDCADGWSYAGAEKTVSKIVPGDVIEKTCTFTITAEGDNLAAELTTPESIAASNADGENGSLKATVTADYVLADGNELPGTITEANNGDTVTATVKVDFPFGTETTENANDTRAIAVALDAIDITLVQKNVN